MTTGTFVFLMIVVLFASWVFYGLDQRWGKRWYRSWYNFSHENSLPDNCERGFLCGRSAKTKCTLAVFLAALVIFLLAHYWEGGILTWFFIWSASVPMTIAGFITAPPVLKIWGKRGVLFKGMDKIDEGELKINPANSLRKGKERLWALTPTWLTNLWTDFFGPPATPEASPAPTEENTASKEATGAGAPEGLLMISPDPKAESEAPREPTPEELIGQFTGGRRNNTPTG